MQTPDIHTEMKLGLALSVLDTWISWCMGTVCLWRLTKRESLQHAKLSYELRQIHFVRSGLVLSQSAVGHAPNSAESFYISELGTVCMRSRYQLRPAV